MTTVIWKNINYKTGKQREIAQLFAENFHFHVKYPAKSVTLDTYQMLRVRENRISKRNCIKKVKNKEKQRK